MPANARRRATAGGGERHGPLAKFFALYIAKRGFLDGRAGFTYATLQAIYEYMIVLKTRELGRAGIRCNCG